jgi:hypothetical protein
MFVGTLILNNYLFFTEFQMKDRKIATDYLHLVWSQVHLLTQI